jgi:hypothetical protein
MRAWFAPKVLYENLPTQLRLASAGKSGAAGHRYPGQSAKVRVRDYHGALTVERDNA